MVLIIDKKRSIGEAAKEIGIQEHVIRFWETQFSDYIKPTLGAGNRRYFYDKDIKILKTIKYYLYEKGFTIKGLQNLLKNETVEFRDKLYNKNPILNNQDKNDKIDTVNNNNEKNTTSSNIKEKYNEDPKIKDNLKQLKNKLNIFYEKLKSI